MNQYTWKHYRKFHSYSMMDEPIIHHDLYTYAEVVVVASSQKEALRLIQEEKSGWILEGLESLIPQIEKGTSHPRILKQIVQGE